MSNTFKCPFCNDGDFDKVGLKYHLEMGYCEEYNNTLAVHEEHDLIKLQQKLESEKNK